MSLVDRQKAAVARRELEIRLGKRPAPTATVLKFAGNHVGLTGGVEPQDPRSSTSPVSEKPAGAVTVPITVSAAVNNTASVDNMTERLFVMQRDIRDMEARIGALLAECDEIDQEGPAIKRPTVRQIISAVARYYKVSGTDMMSSRRTASIVRPRHIAMYLSKTLTLNSLPEIGKRMGGRDHTTVLVGLRKIQQQRQYNKELDAELTDLTATLTEKTNVG
jgi:hypothetical protein